jgi:hypothetical protein
VTNKINELIGGASSAYDTLLEIQNELSSSSSAITSINTAIAGKASLSDVQANNNTWTGSNAFNTSLPTSTVTPTTSTQLITKAYADATYSSAGSILGTNNTFTGTTNTFQDVACNGLTTSSINNSGVLNSTGLITANGGLTIPSGDLLNLNGDLYANATTISPTVLSYLSGATSNIQSQINTKTTLATVQSNANVWSSTNTYNTSLPTSTLTPTTSTQLITKSYADATYPIKTSSNTFTTSQTFQGNVNINGNTGYLNVTTTNPVGAFLLASNRLLSGKNLILLCGTNNGIYNGLTQANDAGIYYGPDSTFGFLIIAPNRTTAPTAQGSRWDSTGNLTHSANLTVATGFTTALKATTATTLSTSGLATLNSLSVSGTSTLGSTLNVNATSNLNSTTFINTTSGTTAVGLVINNSNPAGTGASTTALQLTQGNYGCQLSGLLTQGVGASFNLSVGEKTTPIWNTIMSGDQNTLTVASTTTVVNNLTVNNNGVYFNPYPSPYTPSNIYQSYYNLNVFNNCGTSNGNGNINFGFDISAWKFTINTGFAVFNTNVVFNNGLQVASGQTSTLSNASATTLSVSGTSTFTGNQTNSGTIATNNNVTYGTNSTILVTNTTLSWPLNTIIFVNATTTGITVTLPTLTSANDGLVVTIRALPTCTQNVAINFSSSQVVQLINTSTLSTYNLINTSPLLRLTAINNYWLQI